MLGLHERGTETPNTLEKIQALDKVMSEPIVVTEEQLEEAVGNNQEKRKQIAVFLMHHEMLRQEGVWVPYHLNNGQLRWSIYTSMVLPLTKTPYNRFLISIITIPGRLVARDRGSLSAENT